MRQQKLLKLSHVSRALLKLAVQNKGVVQIVCYPKILLLSEQRQQRHMCVNNLHCLFNLCRALQKQNTAGVFNRKFELMFTRRAKGSR